MDFTRHAVRSSSFSEGLSSIAENTDPVRLVDAVEQAEVVHLEWILHITLSVVT
jgi:hypothetical protein